jgi:histidinol-phosphate/aromatic aminotransferase/cobyric acid decarboxylase-like protein
MCLCSAACIETVSDQQCCALPVAAAVSVHQYQADGHRSAVLVQVRHYAKASLSNYIRVSVGKPEHTDALEAVLRRV